MRFVYNLIDKLPALAWLAVIKKNIEDITVLHGKAVECKGNWFAAGVWDGDFMKGDMANASFACCTSGLLSGGYRGG